MPKKTEITTTETSHLSVFDYSQLSEQQIRKSLEIKGQMISVGKRVSDDLLYLAELAKEQHDNLNSYSLFIDWCNKEMGYSLSMAKRFLRVGKMEGSYGDLKKIPDSLKGLDAIASALLKADSEEEKEEITQAINEATEEKGKPLTEKEIKEIVANQLGKVKQILNNPREAVKHTNEDLADQFSLPLAIVIEARENIELKRGEEILKGDRTHLEIKVKELEDKVKTHEKKESDLEKTEEELKKKEEQLNKKEEQLNKHIEVKVKEQVTEKTEEELNKLDKQKAQLEKEKAQISQELKDVQNLKRTAQRQKDNLNSTQEWITNFQLTNSYLVEATNELKKYKKHLQKNPDLSELEEVDRLKVEQKIKDLIVDFNDNLHNLGGAINYLNGAIVKFNNHALKVIDAEVTDNE